MGDVLEAVHRELHDAALTGYKQIVHIRVTTDALRGSVTSMPITPERARTLGRLLMMRSSNGPLDGTVVADPADYETMLELLMHPADWTDLLTTRDAAGHYPLAVSVGAPTRVMGIPVTY